jgi:uncharacterized protein DUF6918
MASLKDLLGTGDKRGRVVDDSMRVLDLEVDDKSGLTGIAVKTTYKLVKGISPGFIREVVDHLLDDFLNALDPLYQEALSRGIAPRQHLQANPERVADALLAITDARAQKSKNQLVKGAYEKLRSQAKKHVMAAVPRLGELFDRHATN